MIGTEPKNHDDLAFDKTDLEGNVLGHSPSPTGQEEDIWLFGSISLLTAFAREQFIEEA